MKRLARAAGAAPFRVLPAAARRRLVQLVLTAASRRVPADAMRELLDLDTDVTGMINETALVYGGGIHVKHRLMRYHDFFVERIATGERVLDIGCGYGAVAHSIASRSGATVLGIDMSHENIVQAQRTFVHPLLSFVVGVAPEDVPHERFDVIVLSNVLEHLERRVEFLRGVEEWVAPSRWLIRVPMFNREWRVPMRQELGMYYFGDPTHFIEYTRDTFEAEMREAALTIVELTINWGEIWAVVRRAASPPQPA